MRFMWCKYPGVLGQNVVVLATKWIHSANQCMPILSLTYHLPSVGLRAPLAVSQLEGNSGKHCSELGIRGRRLRGLRGCGEAKIIY